MTGFQTQVGTIQAPAVEGDFASANPRASVLAGEGGLVAGNAILGGISQGGVVVGRFAWLSYLAIDNDEAPAVGNNFGAGVPAGIVHREQQGLITTYLAEAGMVLPTGFALTLFNDGDFWIKNRGSTAAQVGMKAYANNSDGSCRFGVAGAPLTASGSTSSIAAATFNITGSIADNILTATVINSGSVQPGGTISGTGVATGTKVLGQVLPLKAGEALNGIGRYYVSIPQQVVASTTIAGTYGVLTVGGTVAGTWGAGQLITGTNVVAGTTTYNQLTGTTGGAGTYVVDNNTVVSSTAITAQVDTETKWYAKSAGAVGDIIKISARV